MNASPPPADPAVLDYQSAVRATMRRLFVDVPDLDPDDLPTGSDTESLLWLRLREVKSALREHGLLA